MSGYYDQSFKLLADGDPRAALAIIAGIALDDPMEITPLPRELPLPALMADNLYECSGPEGRSVLHVEACTNFRADTLTRQTGYISAAAIKLGLPVKSYLLLLTSKGVPAFLPEKLDVDLGDYQASFRLRIVKLWEIPGERILALNRPALYPWTPLTAATVQQEQEALRRITAARDRENASRMAILGGLRYGSKEKYLERIKNMTVGEILEASSVYQEILRRGKEVGLDEGREQGREQGREEAREEALGASRGMLARNLAARFGPLPGWAADQVGTADLPTISRWNDHLFTAPTLASIFANPSEGGL